MDTKPAVRPRSKWHLNPTQTLVFGFAVLIFIGALLLNLPFASRSRESIDFLDALFTATSASCVTGQVVVNTAAHWSTFGRVVIICLIQIGGLGVITLTTTAAMLLHRNIDLRSRVLIGTAFGQECAGGMVRLIRNVWKVTFLLEGCGAVLLTAAFYFSGVERLTFLQALARGVFHSISAFCNAGFDIIGPDGLMPYVSDPFVCVPIMLLIIFGGIGFPVWVELRQMLQRQRPLLAKMHLLSVHTKIVLSVTVFLILFGACLFLLFESANPATLGPLSWPDKVMAAFFQSVTLRTAGFNTINQGGLNESSQFFSCLLMVSGGSPSGTAGGIKTTTVGVLFLTMVSALRGKNRIEAFGRELSLEILQKAICVMATLGIVWIGGTTLLCIFEQGNPFRPSFLDLLFECASVSGTVGVSTGVTPYLSAQGRVVCIASMFLGRLGPVTVAIALTSRIGKKKVAADIRLPEETMIIG